MGKSQMCACVCTCVCTCVHVCLYMKNKWDFALSLRALPMCSQLYDKRITAEMAITGLYLTPGTM